MDSHLRPSGIEGLGNIAWGTHFCLFYETKEDLLDFLVPYFKTGVEHHEAFLYIASEPLEVEEARHRMREALPDFDRYMAEGQIEIIPFTDWYLKAGHFDEQQVMQGWTNKVRQALAAGLAGLRTAANILLEPSEWKSFTEYEARAAEIISGLQMEALCTYNLNRYSAANILDIVRYHEYTLARRNGRWESVEGDQLKRAHEEALKLNAELEQRVTERTAELTSTNAQLREEEQQNQKLLRDLEERVKELATLHGWARILQQEEADILNVLRRLVSLLPPAFQYPESTVARIQIGERQVMTPGSADSVAILHTEFATTDGQTGSFEVGYTQDYPSVGEGPFLLEERNLINTLTEMLRIYLDRKQAEEALHASEEKFSAAFRASPVALLIATLDGRFVEMNQAFCDLLGYSREELIGKTGIELGVLNEEVRQEWVEAIDRNGGVITNRELSFRLGNGISRTTLISIEQITFHGIRHHLSTILDITERKAAEEAIRKSEQVLLEAESLGHTGSWEHNLITDEIFNTEENQHLFFGDDYNEGTDFQDYAQAVHSDDREYVIQRRVQLLAEGGPRDIEYRVVWPDGSVHVIFGRATVVYDEFGQPIRVYGTNVDITERKQAEERIRQYAVRMEALAQISQTFAEAGLDYQGVLNTVAQRTAESIGDSCVITLFSEDKQRSFPVAFYHRDPNALAMMREALLRTWQGGTDTQRYQALLAGNPVHIPTLDSEEFKVSLEPEFWNYQETIGISSVLIVPLEIQSNVIGTLGMTRDHQGAPYTGDDLTLLQNIADRAAMSIQNAQLFRQVQSAREQLEALSRRLLEVQEAERRAITTELHDRVGQNLTGLSINLQNMKALLPDETAQRLAKQFDDAQALLEDTTSQIRGIMAELHLPELEDYGLAVALETYAERAASRGNLKLVTNLPDLATPPLPSDVRIALFRSAQEAISNVIKHADATQLKVSLEELDGRIRLIIEDNGSGFDPKFASHKEAQTWGLKIMRERIESIGGNIQIKSEPGKGTRITFEVERPS